MDPKDTHNGTCFKDAVDALFKNADLNPKLVHGAPYSPFHKIRIAHAWIEYEDSNKLLIVKDVTEAFPGNSTLPAALYYYFGKMNDGHVKKYTLKEAIDFMLKHETYGPWEELADEEPI